MTRDARVDDYIDRAQLFARPILGHIRDVVHEVCPEISETIKWGFPHFEHRGRILASMAAFKAHASLGLWRIGSAGPTKIDKDGMGQFGRLASLSDLPSDADLKQLLTAALAVIDEGKIAPRAVKPRPPLPVPAELADALARSPEANAVFEAFSPSNRRDYCEWVGEAKRAETRTARATQAIEWLREGKTRNWKYQR